MRFWIDIDNPPQVQYLMPLAESLYAGSDTVVLTARDYGVTRSLLADRGAAPVILGAEFGAGKLRKARGVLQRAGALVRAVRRRGGADVLVCSSRSGALAARIMGIPSFIVSDYEFSELGLYRRFGSFILHPDVIPAEAFTSQGWAPGRLIAFEGLKEDLSFAGRDPLAVTPHDFGLAPGRRVVIFRPPAEQSHYYNPASRELALAVLAHLADDGESTTVVSPRHRHQVDDVARLAWRNPPIVLERPIAFDALLAAADLVVCAGGTMLREAAWLGIPAVSIFQSRVGAVDTALEREGRIAHVSSGEEFAHARERMRDRMPARRVPTALGSVIAAVRSRAFA